MQKSYLEVIEQFILDTNTKHSGLSEVGRFSKVIKLEGLEYDSFLFNAFKRVEKELDEIDMVTAIEAGMGYRYFNYLRVVAKVLDCPNYTTIHAVGNFITASAGLVSADNPVMPYMVDRAQYVSEDGWLIKALAARGGFDLGFDGFHLRVPLKEGVVGEHSVFTVFRFALCLQLQQTDAGQNACKIALACLLRQLPVAQLSISPRLDLQLPVTRLP
jgi:hypothetical protein